MPVELRFTCPLHTGIHARPASLLAEVLAGLDATIRITQVATGAGADARGVLSVVALDIKKDDECHIVAEGPDAQRAIDAIKGLIARQFDEPQAGGAPTLRASPKACAPAGIRRMGVRWIGARSISAGCVVGPSFHIAPFTLEESILTAAPQSREAERAAVNRALAKVRSQLEARRRSASRALERDLLAAHIGIISDPALTAKIHELIDTGVNGPAAVLRTGEFFAARLRQATSQYVRDRVVDVRDVVQQTIESLIGHPLAGASAQPPFKHPAIVIAESMTPRQMMGLDRSRVLGLVLGAVGATSHTVILARALGVPALIDADISALHDAAEIVIDADSAVVVSEVTHEVRRYYDIEARTAKRRRERLAAFAARRGATRDGVSLEVGVNIASDAEAAGAFEQGADGVGLFRTEMLFLGRDTAPTEEEQFTAYAGAVQAARGKPVIIRTLDIGADKPAPYLRIPAEENPFLGQRGIRLSQQHPHLLDTQLLAIARASAIGPVKVMAPMVATASEARWFVDQVRRVQNELLDRSIKFDTSMPVGVMIEVPSAALILDQLSDICDFFSIGTNDLCSYLLAADRGNPGVASICDPLQPAFLRMLRQITDAARRHNRWIGVCGDMAGDPRHLPLMVGLQLDEISVSPARVLELKATLAQLDDSACRELLKCAEAAESTEEVRALLAAFRTAGSHSSVIDAQLVAIGSEAQSKIEAIKELSDLLSLAGRTDDPRAVEQAVWAREETYATGLGFGFAIPHCRTDAVSTPAVAFARLRQPIDWGATDGVPVQAVIMLAIPAASSERAHMQVLAKLARKLMHEEFRQSLLDAGDAPAIAAILSNDLTPS